MDSVNRNHSDMVLELLGERVRQARKPSHAHSHRQVVAFNVGRAYMIGSGSPLITFMSVPIQRAGNSVADLQRSERRRFCAALHNHSPFRKRLRQLPDTLCVRQW